MEGSLPIVIIGAGTVGLLLAHELMQKGEKIILIEAGGDSFQPFNSNEYTNIGHGHNGVSMGRTRGMGGTTNLWGGQLAEFIPHDINAKQSMGQPAWPIAWEEFCGYYSAVYKKLGFSVSSPIASEKLASTAHQADLEIFYTRWLKQPNFKNHFLAELENSELVTIYKNTVVTNLHFQEKKCRSITVNKNGKTEEITEFGKIILTHGTIEICRLLLIAARSGDCPFAKNPWIGKYFQDHINVRVGRVTKASRSFFKRFSNIIMNGEKLQPKIRINNIPAGEAYLGICGIFSFDSKVSGHLDNFKQFSKAILSRSHQKAGFKDKLKLFGKVIRGTPQIMVLIYHYIKNNRIYVPFRSTVSLNLQTQQVSIEGSNISLAENDYDPIGRPKAIINWQIDGREFASISRFCFDVREYLSSNGLGNLEFEKWFEEESAKPTGNWLKQVSDVYHQAGCTIMSDNSDTGVVNDDLKLHDTENLFVCGAAVMPTSSFANTTLTALALAMRLADHLKERTGI